jgi:hypothetical protein
MNLLKVASIFLCCMLAARLSAGERLVYAVTHGAAGGRTTEVFAISPEETHPSRVFSDVSSPVILGFMSNSGTSAPSQTAVSGNRLYAPGKERALNSGAIATGIFEFSLDDPGRYRKILDMPAGERVDLLIVDGASTKLAYLSLSASRLTFFVHDVKTGSLLHQLDMAKVAGNCVVRGLGWLPDGKTLFFTLEEGVDGFMEDADYKRIGTWLIQDDGTLLTRLPASLGKLQEPGYRSDSPPLMLGVVNGEYLFHPHLYKPAKEAPSSTFLALSNPHSGTNAKIELQQPPGVSEFVLSHSGRYVAYVQQSRSKFVGNNHIVPPEHVWIKLLPAGEPREVLSLETGQERGLSLTLMGWMGD